MNSKSESNKEYLCQLLFNQFEKKSIFINYIKHYFQFLPEQSVSFLSFYNAVNLPFFISKTTFNGIFHNKPSLTQFIQVVVDFFIGDFEKVIDILFHILDIDKDNYIHLSNTQILFSHFNVHNSNSSLENIGKEIILNFFGDKNKLSYSEYIELIYHSNSDLIYLFYFFYINNLFINADSFEHYERNFEHGNYFYSEEEERQRFNNEVLIGKIVFPSDTLLDFLNQKFSYKFKLNEELDELDMFENQFIECRTTLKRQSLHEFPNRSLKLEHCDNKPSKLSSTSTKSVKEKKSHSLLSLLRHSIFDFNLFINIPCLIVHNGIVSQLKMDIVGNVIFVYQKENELTYMFPIYHLFIEYTSKQKEYKEYINNGYHPVVFYSTISNVIQKNIIFFKSKDIIDSLKMKIESKRRDKFYDSSQFSDITQLGEGSFGKILKAYDNNRRKEVAIKVLHKDYNDIELVQMIRNEEDISFLLKETSHQGIIDIYDIYESKDNVYIIEEYIEHGNLSLYLQNNTSLSSMQREDMIKQLAEAIDFLHSYGIVHRDLKLENILVSSLSPIKIKIIDFGLSTVVTLNEQMSEKYGTLIYLSPEIVTNNKYTNKIDIWDFGIIAYTILNYGVHPFSSETKLDGLMEKIILRKFNYEHIDDKYKKLLINCFQKESKRANSKELVQIINKLF